MATFNLIETQYVLFRYCRVGSPFNRPRFTPQQVLIWCQSRLDYLTHGLLHASPSFDVVLEVNFVCGFLIMLIAYNYASSCLSLHDGILEVMYCFSIAPKKLECLSLFFLFLLVNGSPTHLLC